MIVLCVFSVFIGQKCCVHTVMYARYMRVTCLKPDVEFKESKIVFYVILIMLGIKFSNLEFNK